MNAVSLQCEKEPEAPGPNAIIRLVLPEGEEISRELAESFAQKARDEAGTVLRPVLLVISGVAGISREARTVFSGSRSASAVAVVGSTSVDRVLASFLLGAQPAPCPTRYFTDEDAAARWLLEHTVDS